MIWLWRLTLIVLVASGILLSVSYRMGGAGPNDFTYPEYNDPKLKGIEGLLPTIQPWQLQRSDALIQQSINLFSGDQTQDITPEQRQHATELAQQALRQDFTNGQGFAQLLGLYEKTNDLTRANQVAELASELWPAYSRTRAQIADYYARHNNIPQLLNEWNVLLTRNGNLYPKLFPLLVGALKEPDTQALLIPYMEKPPRWWEAFFSFVANSTEPIELVDFLYEKRRASSVRMSARENKDYVARLMREGFWDEARLAWTENLKPYQINLGGLVYNGGFEDEQVNTGGFDWQFTQDKLVSIKTSITQGMKGAKALRVQLSGQGRINFQHISQPIVLEPGNYELLLRYRIDKLRTDIGLSWRIRCLDTANTLIAESPPLKERTPWIPLSMRFSVPVQNTCKAQQLRLEATSTYAHQHLFDGILWFDDIVIRPVVVEDAPQ